ncbi:MAG: ATP-binding protein [Oscillospiraceae bacterium]|jgi:AAA+ ATPase superfamily predicted ATPase|nr:ATP-binding protein [Oscillospiraceae bacterium]
MFVGRKSELATLKKLYNRPGFQFVVVYGRRRVGKTALINEFVRGKPNVFFAASESSAMDNLVSLSRCVGGSMTAPVFGDYESVLTEIFLRAARERFVFVIDEYPYLAEAYRGVSSLLQVLIDKHQQNSQLFLILCGSSMSFMENQVLGYQSPLYGRRTAQCKVLPFDYFDCAEMYPSFSNEDKIALYGVTGGVPEYAARIDPMLSLRDNLLDLLFDSSGRLFEEPPNLLKQELKNPQTYNSIISAIASGHTRLNEIATAAGIETSQCSHMLATLISLGLVKKELPTVSPNPRKGIYLLADQMFRFWYRFVLPNQSRILVGIGDVVCDEVLSDQFHAFLGLTFEECCKQYMWRLLRAKSAPVNFREVGRWWGSNRAERREEEIDIIAWNATAAIFSECKWRSASTGLDALDELVRKSQIFGQFNEKHHWLFSQSGYTDALKERAAHEKSVRLVELWEMFA